MITKIIDKLFGTKSMRFLKKKKIILDKINELEKVYNKLSGDELREKIKIIRQEIKNKKNPSSFYLPDVFAMVRESAIRTIGHRHYDVQIMAAIALYEGYVVEMGTGEGKTLVATLTTFLRALEGQVHVITVNDYLAQRDCELMGKIHEYLGLTVGFCTQETNEENKNIIFTTHDIIYISNQQIVFYYLSYSLRKNDYIRYNGKKIKSKFEQYCAIVDEVDNILIDEAKNPFIISQQADKNLAELYGILNFYIKKLEKEKHFIVDFKSKFIALTDEGTDFLEKDLQDNGIIHGSLFSSENSEINHIISSLLKAHNIFRKDIEYAVIHDEVVIIDESTGRLSFGRRYSGGLHQALEAKEEVKIKDENKTMLSITYLSFFSSYNIKCGMTGTASTEKEEFLSTYKLEIIQIPPNRKKIRIDNPIRLYKSRELQLKNTIDIIKEKHEKGQPILIVTTNVKESEDIEYILTSLKIPHRLLNAKNHKQEAEFIANAGVKGAITIATNMAGRGTDIKLGGNIEFKIDKILMLSTENNENIINDELNTNSFEKDNETEEEEVFLEDIRFSQMNLTNSQKKQIKEILESYEPLKNEVKELGGLVVIIFGMPESEKILLQALGRSGRQGDPGESFSLFSIDDDLLTTSLQDSWNKFVFSKIFEENEEYIDGGPVVGLVRRFWGIITAQHFRSRKELNKYEEVKDNQRKDFFHYRDEVLTGENTRQIFIKSMEVFYKDDYNSYTKEKLQNIINFEFENLEDLKLKVNEKITEKDEDELFNMILRGLDWAWFQHIQATESVETGSGLMSYAQKDPFHEFRTQMSNAFQLTVRKFRLNLLENLFFNEEELLANNPIYLDENFNNLKNSKDFSSINFSDLNINDMNLDELMKLISENKKNIEKENDIHINEEDNINIKEENDIDSKEEKELEKEFDELMKLIDENKKNIEKENDIHINEEDNINIKEENAIDSKEEQELEKEFDELMKLIDENKKNIEKENDIHINEEDNINTKEENTIDSKEEQELEKEFDELMKLIDENKKKLIDENNKNIEKDNSIHIKEEDNINIKE